MGHYTEYKMYGFRIKLGLEVLEENLDLLEGKRLGIVTNHTGVRSDFKHLIDILYLEHKLDVRVLFAPEHGLRGELPPGTPVRSFKDLRTGPPIVSLFGEKSEPPRSLLRRIDVIIYDIQDVGVRFYTYISTLFHVLKAAGEYEVEALVLDRPNPITGVHIEGPVIDRNFRSFIGIWYIPIRYGLTPGELALLFNEEADLKVNLNIVKMRGWRRNMWFEETGLFWVPPSPNIPTPETAIVYPGTCLLEGTNVSEGRGTTKPFEIIGAPWIDEYRLIEELETMSLRGVKLRPVIFIPRYGKYSNQVCHGLQIYITDRNSFKPIRLGLALILAIRQLHPGKFSWVIKNDKYYFDFLIGNSKIRELIEEGVDLNELIKEWEGDLVDFERRRRKYFLYT